MRPIRKCLKHGICLLNCRGRKYRKWRLTAIALVCLTMMANVSQGMVLCFGARGHVAIEPAGHRHCDGTIHDHNREHSAESAHGDAIPLFTPPQYDPCVDIPLPLGPPHQKFSSSILKTAVVAVIAEPPAVFGTFGLPSAGLRNVLSFAHDTLLGTIVLQV